MSESSSNLPVEKVSFANVEMETSGGGGMLSPKSLGDMVGFAQVMARADIALPKHLRGNAGACLAVTMQAMRWEMDPFAVANKSYSVNDRLAFEAQLVAAVVHTRAPIKGRPNYLYAGEGNTRQCQVVCVMADGEEREYTSPRFEQILTKNSPLWKSDPDQQLGYFSIRSWARRHAPEVILGVYTPDEVAEFREIRDVTPAVNSGLSERLRLAKEAGGGNVTAGFTSTHAETAQIDPLPDDDVPATGGGTNTKPLSGEDAPLQAAGESSVDTGLKPNLVQRIASFKTRVDAAGTPAAVLDLKEQAAALFADVDVGDPDEHGTVQELDAYCGDRIVTIDNAQAAGGAA